MKITDRCQSRGWGRMIARKPMSVVPNGGGGLKGCFTGSCSGDDHAEAPVATGCRPVIYSERHVGVMRRDNRDCATLSDCHGLSFCNSSPSLFPSLITQEKASPHSISCHCNARGPSFHLFFNFLLLHRPPEPSPLRPHGIFNADLAGVFGNAR